MSTNQTRRGEFKLAGSSIDREARTAELVFMTETPVRRSDYSGQYWEVLRMKGAKLERLNSGRAPLLAQHSSQSLNAVIGVIESARIEGGVGIARVRFSRDQEADRVFQKVSEGVLTNVSVGYSVARYERAAGDADEVRTMHAVDFTPHEISIVSIGADQNAFVRSAENQTTQNKEQHTMQNQNQNPGPTQEERGMQLERERVVSIERFVRSAGLEASFATAPIADGSSLDQVRILVLNELARKSDETQHNQHTLITGRDLGHDGLDNRIRSMGEALAARATGAQVGEQAKQYLPLDVTSMARNLLEARGVSTRLMSRSAIIDHVLGLRGGGWLASRGGYASSSDFSALLTETGNRILRQAYAESNDGIKMICKVARDANDFRPRSLLQLGAAGELPLVPEGAEFVNFPMIESKSSYTLATYGGIFGITRQALVNDSLQAFASMAQKLGRASANTLATLLTSKLTANPIMNDGVALFHSSHGNLAPNGAAPGVNTIGEGIRSLRYQKDIDGVTLINAPAKFLVVPAALETTALQLMATINATESNAVNPFKLTVVVDPRLDASSTSAWYLAADPYAFDTIEYVDGLGGAGGPEVIIEDGFRVDGRSWRVRTDLGAGVIDWRGLWKNPGAPA